MYFTYKGKSSEEFGLKIIKSNHLSSPSRMVESVPVPGRNGNLLIDSGCYENFQLRLECDIDAQKSNLNTVVSNLKKWLQATVFYSSLVLVDSTGVVKTFEAAFINKLDIEETFKNFGATVLIFECKPDVD